MKRNIRRNISLMGMFLLAFSSISLAQQASDFENIEEVSGEGFWKNYMKGLFSDFTNLGDPFVANGGIGINARTYNSWGIDGRQPPFFWIINANLNISIYKLNIPFSALISVDRRELELPSTPGLPPVKERFTNRFNRIGFSPYYKWMKLHAGHRNMTFSQFTLANLTYLGGGFELTPGKVRLAAMYGRLAQAEPVDLSLLEPNLPVFERTGWGTKIGYGDNNNFIDFIIFKGWDDEASIPFVSPQEVFPNENLVLGINAKKQLFDKFQFGLDFANSAFTNNVNDATTGNNSFFRPSFLFDERASTLDANAIETTLDYAGTGFNAGVKYRRIDPGYRSMGAYYFNNDIEDYTANANWSMFQQKVQVSGSAGLQQDNLDNSKSATLTRFIGSANINYTQDQFNLGLTYSNYSSDIAFVFDPELDSLNVVVVTNDAGINAAYTITDKAESQHTFTLAANLQDVTDDISDPQQSAASEMLNINAVYAYVIPATQWRFTLNGNYNQNMLAMMNVDRWGAGFGVSKSFLENKLNTGFNVNWFRATIESLTNIQNQTLNARLRGSFKINDQHALNLSYNLLNRRKSDDMGSDETFSEGIGNFGYRFNFSVNPSKKKEQEAAN